MVGFPEEVVDDCGSAACAAGVCLMPFLFVVSCKNASSSYGAVLLILQVDSAAKKHRDHHPRWNRYHEHLTHKFTDTKKLVRERKR